MKYPIDYETDQNVYDDESTVRIKILADCPWKGVSYRYKDIIMNELNASSGKLEFTYVLYSEVEDLDEFEEYIGRVLSDIIEKYLDEQESIKNKSKKK